MVIGQSLERSSNSAVRYNAAPAQTSFCWGDRTQISTIALAASYPPLGVTLGAILGHAICAAIAVIGGRLVASRISERTMTALGGVLFLIFGLVVGWEGASIG